MADLSAVLRKTIDGLPGASPQLRAKVYDKARAAIERQISMANPPLAEDVAAARLAALEDAIERTERHYEELDAAQADGDAAEGGAQPEPMTPAAPLGAAASSGTPVPHDTQPSGGVGEVGPAAPPADLPRDDGRPDHDGGDTAIPAPDMAAPRYPSARRPVAKARSRVPLLAGVAVLVIAGAAGAAYVAGVDFSRVFGGSTQEEVARAPATGVTEGTDLGETPDTAASVNEAPAEPAAPPAADGQSEPPASGTAQAPAATPAEPDATATQDPGEREYTQRLLPDGTESDPGPGTSTANVFDEGTDVAPATAATPPQAANPPAPSAGTAAAVPEGAEVAVFYEERFNNTAGSQHSGQVRWSLVQEAPSEGQPPEPAIRGVVQVPDRNLTMTMTIRRNGDNTLPASHVIEMMFDVPADFAGGEIASVQRLALKPTEQDRGRPLIGVAGKISDGFFWIALNDLQQAVDDNLSLLANEQWVDIPIAYETGQRALLSIEKGAEGATVFRQAITAWQGQN